MNSPRYMLSEGPWTRPSKAKSFFWHYNLLHSMAWWRRLENLITTGECLPAPLLIDHVKTLVFKNSLERRPTPMWKSMSSAEVDEEAMEPAENAEGDPHIEDTSHPKKGNTASAWISAFTAAKEAIKPKIVLHLLTANPEDCLAVPSRTWTPFQKTRSKTSTP